MTRILALRSGLLEQESLRGTAQRAAIRWRWLLGAAVIFVLLVSWRWEILHDPPFFECATGLFGEANFLAESDFDYERLRYREKYIAKGGAYAYMTSVLPTVVAYLMQLLPAPSSVFLVYHLFAILCASVVLVGVYALVSGHAGWLLGALCTAAVASNPLFSAQIDMLGMDLPMTACAVTAAVLVANRWYATSAMAGLLAFLMKPTGAIATFVIIVYLSILLAVTWLSRKRSPVSQGGRQLWSLAMGIGANVLAMTVALGIYRWGGIDEHLLGIIRPENSILAVAVACPDLVLITLAALTASLVVCRRGLRRAVVTGSGPLDAREEDAPTTPLGTLIFCWFMLFVTAAAIVRYGFIPPRYFTLIVPFLFVAVGLLLPSAGSRLRWPAVLLVILVALNLVNWDGKFFPAINEVTAWSRGGDRSRAYLLDLRSTIDAMRAIESQSRDEPIVAGHPFTYFLAFTRMGYVSRPFSGYAINAFEYDGFPNWASVFAAQPRSCVLIAAKNVYYASALATIPPPRAGDEILYKSNEPSPLFVYRKRFAEADWVSGKAERWILDNTMYDPASPPRTVLRARGLAAHGALQPAIYLLNRILEKSTPEVEARLLLGELLLSAGRVAEGEAQFKAVLSQVPNNVAARTCQGIAAEMRHDLAGAVHFYRAATRLDPQSTEVVFRLGMALVRQRKYAEAVSHFRRCVRQDPNQARYRDWLGVSLAELGRFAEARVQFEQALRIEPSSGNVAEHLRQLRELKNRAGRARGGALEAGASP